MPSSPGAARPVTPAHHRVDNLRATLHHTQRQAVGGRDHDEALGRGRDAQRGADLPPDEGLRVKGCKEMPKLVAALRRHIGAAVAPSYETEKVA